MIFGHIFSVNLTDDFTLGDSILNFIGLRAWQGKLIVNNISYDSGIHFTIFYGLGFIILGWLLARMTIKNEYPKVYKSIPIFFILMLFLTPSLITQFN
jgi:hypothetical protein